MRRFALVVGLIVALMTAPATVPAQEAAGVTVEEVGWWSSQPTALAQPERGFQVAAGPQGDTQSVAAIRISIAATEVTELRVHLVEASGGSIGAELGTLRVCTTTAPWTAANPGKLADAPVADCTSSATLTRTTDGSWLGDLTGLAPEGGTVSLVVQPAYQPPVPVGPGMIVTIAAGEFAATGSSSPSTTDTTVDADGGGGDPSTTDLYGSFGGGDFTGDFGTGSFEMAPPAAGGESPPTTAPPATTPEGDDDFALEPVASGGGDSKPWGRLLVLVPLCAGFGAASVQVRRRLAAAGLVAAG